MADTIHFSYYFASKESTLERSKEGFFQQVKMLMVRKRPSAALRFNFVVAAPKGPHSLAGCGKTPISRHSRESGSPEDIEKTGFLLPQE